MLNRILNHTLSTGMSVFVITGFVFLSTEEKNDEIGNLISAFEQSRTTPIPKRKPEIEISSNQISCLNKNIWFEARGEPVEGWKAVFDVTLNRVKDKRWPDTVCKVVYQGYKDGSKMSPQFSWTPDEPKSTSYQNTSLFMKISRNVNKWLEENRIETDSDHYARTEIKRVWMNKMKVRQVVGNHTFYYSDPTNW